MAIEILLMKLGFVLVLGIIGGYISGGNRNKLMAFIIVPIAIIFATVPLNAPPEVDNMQYAAIAAWGAAFVIRRAIVIARRDYW